MGIVPFTHQAEWWLASDGLVLTDQPAPKGHGRAVQKADGSVQEMAILPRPGGPARVLADLGAFKVGKSFGGGIWAAGFAAVPNARVSLVGLEYDLCAPEFEYICEALLSDKGMRLGYDSLQNRPRDGRMYLDLKNGCRFEAKSWERKDTLKGKEIDAYVFCEAFMLPGLECYTSNKQNLRARDGYALFATTPDRPWVQILHECGHGNPEFPEWHCTCSVHASVNPFTFNQRAMEMDDPQHGGLMTRDKFAIAYEGKLGDYVGKVFDYARGQKQFTPATHPFLFKGGEATFSALNIPDGWKVEGAVDTGTFMAALFVAFSPEGDAFVLWEQPNYRYVANEPELYADTSVPEWGTGVATIEHLLGVHAMWADKNTQFRFELQRYGVTLLPATVRLEARTEVARAYFQANRVWFAPWLKVLPYELEGSQWPEEASLAGKFERLKRNDHLVDCLEHLLARHPKGRVAASVRPQTWAESALGVKPRREAARGNQHLGPQ